MRCFWLLASTLAVAFMALEVSTYSLRHRPKRGTRLSKTGYGYSLVAHQNPYRKSTSRNRPSNPNPQEYSPLPTNSYEKDSYSTSQYDTRSGPSYSTSESYNMDDKMYVLMEEKGTYTQDKYSPKEDKYSPKEDKYSPKEDKYSPKEDKYSPKEDKYSPKEDKYSPKEDKYSSMEDKKYVPMEMIDEYSSSKYDPDVDEYDNRGYEMKVVDSGYKGSDDDFMGSEDEEDDIYTSPDAPPSFYSAARAMYERTSSGKVKFVSGPSKHAHNTQNTPDWLARQGSSRPVVADGHDRPSSSVWPPASSGSTRPSQGGCTNFRKCSSRDQEYRTFDGTCNNLAKSSFGAAGTPFRRELPRRMMLAGCGGTGTTSRLPNPRLVSRLLIRRGSFDRDSHLSLMTMVWGQMIDHDIEITPPRTTPDGAGFLDCCSEQNRNNADCCPIVAQRSDPFYGKEGRPRCMPFIRSRLVQPPCDTAVAEKTPDVVNLNTAWVDASFVYGSDDVRASELRTGSGGLLKSTNDRRGRMFPPMSNEGNKMKMAFGDHRGDVHPGFSMLTTAFLRNHNKLARGLAHLNPSWDDEKLYQEARKINSAMVQHITYAEFLPALLGRGNDVSLEPQSRNAAKYDSKLNGGIGLGFATAGYRLHTYVPDRFVLRNKHYQVSDSMLLRDVFHAPGKIVANNTYDDMIRGLNAQPMMRFNNVFSPEMTEWLFADPATNFGMDIAALNIQRGRDHMIPAYPSYRKHCGLSEVDTWGSMSNVMPSDLVHRLSHTYSSPDDVDLYVGASMEPPVSGSVLGATNHCLIRRQFKLLRDGDRFFYSNPGQFTPSQLSALRSQTLASILCINSDDPRSMSLPKEMFKISSQVGANRRFRCDDRVNHRRLDLAAWRE